MLTPLTRPGICYYCRNRPGTLHYRGMSSCRRCLRARETQDTFLIIVVVLCMATIVGMVAKRNGYCPQCPDVPMPVLHLIQSWMH